MTVSRRGFLRGLGGLIVAPAIVRATSLMKISPGFRGDEVFWCNGIVGGTSLYAELSAITRKAFVPRLFAQVMFESPSLKYLNQGVIIP